MNTNLYTASAFYQSLVDTGRYCYWNKSRPNAIRMAEKKYPVSITSVEFDALHTLVASTKRQVAYEIATGFGVSACAIGLGLRQTNGKLLTIDAYIEESYDSDTNYLGKERTVADNPIGLAHANELFAALNITNVIAKKGWSPDDVPALITDIFGNLGIDFIFIDGGHTYEQVMNDLNATKPFRTSDCIVALHDSHIFNQDQLKSLEQELDCKFGRVLPHNDPNGFNLIYTIRP